MEVPEIALGCMRITGLKDKKEREALLDTALELGVNFFDHADIYDAGHAERSIWRNDRDHLCVNK